ncbi:MAG: TRAP transporter substrate-binding protein DctP [Burkholderiales bacterium]|nr:MAG: TRAP transporter substrate-binding protein DctP [Burkholderiales bacterium]
MIPRAPLALGAAGLALATMAMAATAAEVKLKAAAFLPARAIIAQPFHRWIDEVNKQCAGKVNVTVVGPEAVPSLEQWNALKNGVVDMHYGPANYFRGAVPAGDVLSVARVETAEQRTNGAWAAINEEYNRKLNAQYMTYLLQGVRFHLYTTKPGADGKFEGFRLRSVPIYDAFFKSLGANPVRMAPPAVYTALERGAVDGYGWPLWGIQDFGWHKYTKVRHDPGFINAAVVILVNLDKWKGLTGEQRQCLTDMAVWVENEWPKWRAGEDAKQQAAQKEAGIEVVDLGADFARRAEDAYWADLEKGDPEFVRKVRPLLTR